jgi:hypothetical protein
MSINNHRSGSAHARAGVPRAGTPALVAGGARKPNGGITVTPHPHGVSTSRRVRVTLTTTYAPTGGSPWTLKRFVTLPRRRGARHG